MLKVEYDHDVATDINRIRPSSFHSRRPQIVSIGHSIRSHTTLALQTLWDLIVAHDIKSHSLGSLLIADDQVPRPARPQTTSLHIAVDAQLRVAHDIESII